MRVIIVIFLSITLFSCHFTDKISNNDKITGKWIDKKSETMEFEIKKFSDNYLFSKNDKLYPIIKQNNNYFVYKDFPDPMLYDKDNNELLWNGRVYIKYVLSHKSKVIGDFSHGYVMGTGEEPDSDMIIKALKKSNNLTPIPEKSVSIYKKRSNYVVNFYEKGKRTISYDLKYNNEDGLHIGSVIMGDDKRIFPVQYNGKKCVVFYEFIEGEYFVEIYCE